MSDAACITFRPFEEADLRRMHAWLQDPAIQRWWEGDDVSWPGVVAHYGPDRDRTSERWIALREGSPFGWIQCYRASDEMNGETYHWQPHLDLTTTGGIDYLVGDARHRGRGIGSAMLRAFVAHAFPLHPEWSELAAGPFEANVPSCRALAKAGFRQVGVLPDEEAPCVLWAHPRS